MAVVAAFGTLANTLDAGLTAYFRATGCTALTISDVIPFFSKIIAYEQEYVIGEVKIWDTGSESAEPNNCAMVRVIVYNDGWVCAWFDKETIEQQNTSPAYYVNAQTLDLITGISYQSCYNGMLVEVTASSPSDPECPDGTVFCIRNTNFIDQTIQVHQDKSSTSYHFNSGHNYDITIRQSNGNLVWWGRHAYYTTLPTNLSNRLYRAIYEMWTYLRFSSNSTDSTDTSITKALLDDGGVFTDYTTAFNNTGTNDVPLMPTIEAVNDAFYYGSANKFHGLKLDIDTAGVGSAIVWEYWNGSDWVSLTVTDLTSGFTILTVHNHKVDDTVNPVTSTGATDQATVNTLLNEIKSDYNAHIASTTFHDAADATNIITSDNATDLVTSQTLANEIKNDYNAHRSQAGIHPHNDNENIVTAADAVNLATCITLANEIKVNYNAHLVSTQDANTVTFIPQDDWVKTFVNSYEYYWIRSRVSAAAFTTQPLLTQGWVIVADSLAYLNSNLGMYSFEDTSANYCLLCGINNYFSADQGGLSDKYLYNTTLLSKVIYSHNLSYGIYSYTYKNRYTYPEIICNGKRLFYDSMGPSNTRYQNGYIIINIESIDTLPGSQNVFYLKNLSDGIFDYYNVTQNMSLAAVLITS